MIDHFVKQMLMLHRGLQTISFPKYSTQMGTNSFLKTYSITAKMSKIHPTGTEALLDHGKQSLQITSALELLLASLCACSISTAHYVAKTKFSHMVLEDVIFETVEGVLDVRGFQGKEGFPVHYVKVKTVVKVKTNGTQEQVDQLREYVAKQCPVYSMMKSSGTEMDETWMKME